MRASKSSLVCRRFSPGDKQAVMSLLAASFNGWHGDKSEQFWTWKFERNPHGPAQIYVAEHNGELAGCYPLMPMTLLVGEETLHGAQAVDTAIAPHYRGRGVFIKLARTALNEAVKRGIQVVFAFPIPDSFGGQVRVGYRPAMVIPFVHRPLLWPPRAKNRRGFTIGRADGADARFDVFCGARTDREIRVRRDHRFLGWRYHDHPTNTYTTITCEHHGEICGYSIVSYGNDRGHGSPGYIVDLQVLPGARSAATLLVSHSLRELRSLGARVAVSWQRPSGPEQEALRSGGFSAAYLSIRNRLKRPPFVRHLIALEAQTGRISRADELGADGQVRWSLVPGDVDTM